MLRSKIMTNVTTRFYTTALRWHYVKETTIFTFENSDDNEYIDEVH